MEFITCDLSGLIKSDRLLSCRKHLSNNNEFDWRSITSGCIGLKVYVPGKLPKPCFCRACIIYVKLWVQPYE